MNLKTPKRLSKLYGNLKGFEHCGFTGPNLGEVVLSYKELFKDVCFSLNIEEAKINSIVGFVDPIINQYFIIFYDRMKSIHAKDSKSLADQMKEDSDMLSSVVDIVLNREFQDVIQYCPIINGEFDESRIINICDTTKWYCKKDFCLFYHIFDSDTEDVSAKRIRIKFKETLLLCRCIFRLSKYIYKYVSEELMSFADLFNILLSMSKIFELMNPIENNRQQFLDTALDNLTRKPLDHSDDYNHLMDILNEVFSDIKNTNLPYIRDIKYAISENQNILSSKYEDKDYYYSLKSSGQRTYTKINNSIESSCFEVDVYKDELPVQTFDLFTGYKSYYPDIDPSFDLSQIMSIRTILINNPSKFKPRIIHIADNPIQDRCNYIHNRLKKVLQSMRTDCTLNQDAGRHFACDLTKKWYQETDPLKRIGIYAFDFSNATDTLDQGFQYKVLEFILGTEVANFWDFISKSKKYISSWDNKRYTPYIQLRGQPQGLIGSFDAFALAHHFIFLMNMKINKMESVRSTDFYRVLGDDSIMSSVNPEFELSSDNFVDIEGIPRSILEQTHIYICQNLADFEINHTKSHSVHYNDTSAITEFAKVTYRNGELFSPIPIRLSMNYSSSQENKFALIKWLGDRNSKLAPKLMDNLLTTLNHPYFNDLVKSGMIPFMEPFHQLDYFISDDMKARILYAYCKASITILIPYTQLKEHKRENVDITASAIFNTLLSDRSQRRLDKIDSNHKIFTALERNEDIMNDLHEIFICKEESYKFLSLVYACARRDLEISSDLDELIFYLAKISEDLETAQERQFLETDQEILRFQDKTIRQLTRLASHFTIRSIAVKPILDTKLFQAIIQELINLDNILGRLPSYLDCERIPQYN